ncbi:MAG TPA: lysoplasmalogenase [Acidimicrobiales bacterium]|nr:lysoplasmalogenase [Acidimicrobiales bacterium]
MTGAAFLLLAITLAAAVTDWLAVRHDNQRVEYLCKPLTLVALTGVALALDPRDPTVRGWFVAALVLSLLGDVLLMLPSDLFVGGLAAFLGAHVAYVVGLLIDGVHPAGLLAGLLAVGAAVALVGLPLVAGARRTEPALGPPVMVYMAVISAMLVVAAGTGRLLVIAGAGLFYVSDALIGWNRFVERRPWGDTAVMVTYHLAQILLVLSLV